MKTYECQICHNVNSAAKLHCSTCGTIPARYSILAVPTRLDEYHYCVVARANGSELQTRYRTVKHSLRTVPADYYAEV